MRQLALGVGWLKHRNDEFLVVTEDCALECRDLSAIESERNLASPNHSMVALEAVKKGDLAVLDFPQFFPNQGGLPIQIDGQTIGAISASGAKSEIDEAVAQAGLDALLKSLNGAK